jgi:Stress responsive A/B Barrel Domain
MLTHIVLWKYRADAPQATRDEHVASLRSLSSVVPGIVSLSVGFDTLHLARSFDTGLVGIFQDRSVLEAYTVHPDHVKVVNFGRGISETVVSVDFED